MKVQKEYLQLIGDTEIRMCSQFVLSQSHFYPNLYDAPPPIEYVPTKLTIQPKKSVNQICTLYDTMESIFSAKPRFQPSNSFFI